MYTVVRHSGIREGGIGRWLAIEVPALALSLIVAELFYEFHSFTLECLAFLGTWCTLSYLIELVSRICPQGPRAS